MLGRMEIAGGEGLQTGETRCLGPDSEGRLRVEGAFDLRLALEEREGDQAFGRLLAGIRFATAESVRALLPWSWAA